MARIFSSSYFDSPMDFSSGARRVMSLRTWASNFSSPISRGSIPCTRIFAWSSESLLASAMASYRTLRAARGVLPGARMPYQVAFW